MPEPRKHHYLPQFYLRGFSANGRSIFQIEKRGDRAYLSSIRDTAAIRDYHELDTVGVEDPRAVEKQLAHVETQLAQGLVATLRSGITTPEVHSFVIQLVALLRVRVPAFKATIEAHLQGIVRSTGLMMERRGAFPPRPKGFEDVLRMDNLLINISNWKLLETMFTIAADRDVFNILAAMRPTLLRAPEDASFLTCDQPVAIFHPSASPKEAYGIGIVHPRTEISVPLSTRALLLLSWSSDPPVDRQATPDEIAEFNRRTIVMADALVFASDASESAIETTRRYAHCSAGMVLDVLDTEHESLHVGRFRPVMRADSYPSPPK